MLKSSLKYSNEVSVSSLTGLKVLGRSGRVVQSRDLSHYTGSHNKTSWVSLYIKLRPAPSVSGRLTHVQDTGRGTGARNCKEEKKLILDN